MKGILLLLLCLLASLVKAQDPAYSMFYANPMYLNPGFTGTTQSQRLVFNHRNQWPNIPTAFQTFSASYDINASIYRSGFGIQLNGDKSGTVGLRSSEIDLLYSYKIIGENYVISPGISFGLNNRSFDYNKLIFGDQLNFNNSSSSLPPTLDPALFDLRTINYFDFSAGVLVYDKDTWIGFSFSHLNQPNRSFLKGSDVLPMRVSVHGGFKIPMNLSRHIKKKEYFMPSFVYESQGKFDQLTVGAQFLYEPVILGLFYRGIALQQNVVDNVNQDAIAIMLGFQFKKIDIFYNYDQTVSLLASSSGGAHELAVKYYFNYDLWKFKHKKRQGYIPCPTFHN
jgi:type IX secretion system PorP/SprF family membrane protein